MANVHDDENWGTSGFLVGLLMGTVLGAGLGVLFAPKRGSELRGQLSESASSIGKAASDQYQKVAGAAGSLLEKGRRAGRDVMGRQADAGLPGSEGPRRFEGETSGKDGKAQAEAGGSIGFDASSVPPVQH